MSSATEAHVRTCRTVKTFRLWPWARGRYRMDRRPKTLSVGPWNWATAISTRPRVYGYAAFISIERAGATSEAITALQQIARDDTLGDAARSVLTTVRRDPRRARVMLCTTSPPSRSDTRSTLTTSSSVGYGGDIDRDVIRTWCWLRSLLIVCWLVGRGFDAFAPGCEVDVPRSRM
jgi:hypothetical protein